jgi:hypothetical protein
MLTQAEIDALLSGAIEIEKADNQEGINLAELMQVLRLPVKKTPMTGRFALTTFGLQTGSRKTRCVLLSW